MAVNLNPRASTTTLHDSPTRTAPSQTAALATDPAKREAYIEQANKKFLAAQELAKTDPEAGMQAMKELVKKWQTVMRSNDWDSTDQSFKSELSKLIEQGLDFVQANEDIPTLSEVQSNPESAARYLKSKKKELENIEKNWESDPDFYGQKLVEHYASMAPLLEPETFAQLDPETGADVLKHMERVSELGQRMLAGTTTAV